MKSRDGKYKKVVNNSRLRKGQKLFFHFTSSAKARNVFTITAMANFTIRRESLYIVNIQRIAGEIEIVKASALVSVQGERGGFKCLINLWINAELFNCLITVVNGKLMMNYNSSFVLSRQ